MSNVNARRFLNICLIILTATLCTVRTASAENDTFYLHIKNIDSSPVKITLKDPDACYKGEAVGTIHHIQPGTTSPGIFIQRERGHGCDGAFGRICIAFDPPVGEKSDRCFVFTNDGGLSEFAEAGHPNPYPGKLQPRNSTNGSYTYETYKHPDVKPSSKMVARWEKICQQVCNKSFTHTESQEVTNAKSVTEEDRKSMSLSVATGISPPATGGGHASVTWTGGIEQSTSKSISNSISHGEIYSTTNHHVLALKEMQEYNIFALWRFVADTKLLNGTLITISTDEYTCTSDANTPKYLPGSREDVGACTGSLVK